ncbi:DUF2793 domain-containing protein [Enterovirga rhinocerotis]|uniref:Uncharacterized protein DUF2793 n=1 Tax=Enterovirga rhinocerotis TaxID=1339210 RepID=A0A4R7BY72_9HYPH|nr:DUF2793 domain-containing protein [Enterovirga rhinocerotis]TDR88966.1 uncharacterized protein DUF2793 [Enterovirga rhinocerotis]
MSTTPHLGLPLMAAAQAQKHVTHNEALLALDALIHCAVLDKDLAAAPASPAEGERYIVASSATGSWAGKDGFLATWDQGAWTYLVPAPGFLAYVVDEELPYVFGLGGWEPLSEAIAALQNLARLGIGTAADEANPFSAKLNAALWTARASPEGGSGDLRYTLNKEGAANTLSLLFQAGYSGRFELGLIGSDQLTAKVSADGATWRTAFAVDPSTAGLDFLSSEGTVASASTTDLGAVPHRRVVVTGSATIASFGTVPGRERLLRFEGTVTLSHNATSLRLPGGAPIVTAAGDVAFVTSDESGNWTLRTYQRASGLPASTALATGSASGLMGAADKARLDGLALGSSLVPNGNFEQGLAGWAYSGGAGSGASAPNATDGVSGTAYAVIDRNGVSSGLLALFGPFFPVQPGGIYQFSGFVRGDVASASAGTMTLRVHWYKADGTAAGTGTLGNASAGFTSLMASLTTGWVGLDGQIDAPADATQARIRLMVNAAVSNARYHQFDAVTLRRAVGQTALEAKAVANSRLADVASATLKGRLTVGAGTPEDLTAGQARSLLGLATTDAPAFAGLAATGPVRLPSYTVSGLPAAGTVGRIAYAVNGRAFNGAGTQEAPGAGTGTLVTDDGTVWRIAGTSVAVSA